MPELSRDKRTRWTPRRGVLDCEDFDPEILKGAAALSPAGVLVIQI
jgi:hypothetical protein